MKKILILIVLSFTLVPLTHVFSATTQKQKTPSQQYKGWKSENIVGFHIKYPSKWYSSKLSESTMLLNSYDTTSLLKKYESGGYPDKINYQLTLQVVRTEGASGESVAKKYADKRPWSKKKIGNHVFYQIDTRSSPSHFIYVPNTKVALIVSLYVISQEAEGLHAKDYLRGDVQKIFESITYCTNGKSCR